MKRYLTENLMWKVASVLLAYLLWIVVAREPELAASITVPVLFKDLPEDLDIASDVPERVHLEVRGPAPRLTPESLAQTAVVLDLQGAQPGQRTFNIHDWNVHRLPIGVSFYRAVPSQETMRFEQLLLKDVPIEPAYSKPPPDGYIVTAFTFDPAKVRLRGPETRVRNIDHVTTDAVDLSGLVGQTEKRVNVRVGDPQVRLESNPLVTLILQISKLPNKDTQ